MSDKVLFLDTNVLVYLFDSDEPAKKTIVEGIFGEYSLPNYNLYNPINSFFVWLSNTLRNSIASQLGLAVGVSS